MCLLLEFLFEVFLLWRKKVTHASAALCRVLIFKIKTGGTSKAELKSTLSNQDSRAAKIKRGLFLY